MNSEKQHLLQDLLDVECHTQAALAVGTLCLRRRRYYRSARHALSLALLVIAAAVWVVRDRPQQPPQKTLASSSSAAPTPPAAPGQLKALTDDELLALFPNTPIGLATLPDGKKVLMFLRPGDEARFVRSF